MSPCKIDIVGDQEIVDHGRQNFVDFAGGSEQANLLQTVDSIFFRLPLPHALGDDGSGVGGGRRSDLSRIAENRSGSA